MRSIKAVHTAIYEPIEDLVTYRALPAPGMPMNELDPFLFLNHHGWQQFPPHNPGLPFGPHPHRGFETVTFIIEGDLMHKDSSGGESVIESGGIQWMVAGKGLIHAEISSAEFKEKGGPLELLQLWINLPAKYKMTEPSYTGLQENEIPKVKLDGDKAVAHIVFGDWAGISSQLKPFTDIQLAQITYQAGGSTNFNIGKEKNIFFYCIKGDLMVNGTAVTQHQFLVFNDDEEEVQVHAITDASVLLGWATPFHEPFIAHGPFVMNTREEIREAYDDYNRGLFGNNEPFYVT